MELKTRDKANGRRNNRINYTTALKLEPAEGANHFWIRIPEHFTRLCLNAKTDLVNNARAQKGAPA